MVLLLGSLVLITVNLVRFGSSTVANARPAEQGGLRGGETNAVLELSDGVARTVKYVVIPAALLLIGGVLVRGGRSDDRVHELRVGAGEE